MGSTDMREDIPVMLEVVPLKIVEKIYPIGFEKATSLEVTARPTESEDRVAARQDIFKRSTEGINKEEIYLTAIIEDFSDHATARSQRRFLYAAYRGSVAPSSPSPLRSLYRGVKLKQCGKRPALVDNISW